MSEELDNELLWVANHEEIVSTPLKREEILEILKHINNQDKEIERLSNALNDIIERNSKAIEYIENVEPNSKHLHSMFLCEDYISNYGAIDLLEILKGSDKE